MRHMIEHVPGMPWQVATVRQDGREPTLVYLHGLGCAGTMDWPPVVQARALSRHAALAFDLFGFGQSERPAELSYDLEDQAGWIARFLGATPSVVLVGHSMGGTLAILVAERLAASGRPVDALVLAEPNLRDEDAGMSGPVAGFRVDELVRSWPAFLDTCQPAYRERARLSDPVAFHRSARSLVKHGRGALERFRAVEAGRKGYVLGALSDAETHETARMVAAAGIEVKEVAGSGHFFSADAPDAFAEAIAGFLSR